MQGNQRKETSMDSVKRGYNRIQKNPAVRMDVCLLCVLHVVR
jgi:hypothetical protein